ncbi:hypothetical protein GQ457_12G013940 [Hibiscus cannabinus]
MADSLLAKLGDLTFIAEEQYAVVVTPDAVAIPAEDFASSLVRKVVSPPTVDGSRLIRQFRSIWKDDKVLSISEINPNFFLISFASSVNRTNVLKRGPWDFQKYWFALEQADPNWTIHDYSFQHMCIWVCIHNIPLSLMTAALAHVLGASVGKVIMTDTRLEDGNMGEPDAKASMCSLQYERLPLFYHGCGLIGHSVLACPTTPKMEGHKFQYGAWLRAPLPKRSATRPRGRLSIVDDDLDAPVPVDSASEGTSVRPGSNGTNFPGPPKELFSNWTWKRPLIVLSGLFFRMSCYVSVSLSLGWISLCVTSRFRSVLGGSHYAFYRTLRAKYFPDGDLLHASAPARSSFAWKGLHHAMSRLRDGLYWTLGIDSQVRLYRDRWGAFSPITLSGGSSDNEEVPLHCREFMLPGQACWDHSKLSARLSLEDVDSILEVPISSDRADTLIWGDHDSGLYTILAKLAAVPKVRSFGWRYGRDALPVGSNLRDAGLSDGACQLCGFGLEDTLHAIHDYPDASSALRQAGFADTLLLAGQTTASA